jgi:hypothetical protein
MKMAAIAIAVAVVSMSPLSWSAASAQTTSSPPPIQVQTIRYIPTDSGDESDDYDNFVDNGLWVTFKNVGQRTIKEVSFAIRDTSGFQLAVVDRHGTFSPGVNITRNFGMVKGKHKHGSPARATLLAATFSDGSTWISP